jgi:hypothetical protein
MDSGTVANFFPYFILRCFARYSTDETDRTSTKGRWTDESAGDMAQGAYRYDLRQKVLTALPLDGMRKALAAPNLTQSVANTIDLWLSGKCTGVTKPNPCPHRPSKITMQKYTGLPDFWNRTTRSLAPLWEGESAHGALPCLPTMDGRAKQDLWLSRSETQAYERSSSQ